MVMLANVASDNKKIARRLVGDSSLGLAGDGRSVFKAWLLYYEGLYPALLSCRLCRLNVFDE